MCLYVSRAHKAIYRAGYDILVHKCLRVNYRHGQPRYLSPFRNSLYTLGKIQRAAIGRAHRSGDCGDFEIHKGLHSYFVDQEYFYDIYPAVIPKGALFVLGCLEDVVSNQLIVFPKGHKFPGGTGRADFSKHILVRKL